MRHDLERLEQRWGLAPQSAGFGVWDLDVHHHKVHHSPQWKARLGYGDADEADEVDEVDEVDSTELWRSRVHPNALQPMLQGLSDHLAGLTESYEIEFRMRATSGRYH